jgi:HlyD family secretion protein
MHALLRRPSLWILAALLIAAGVFFANRARGPLVHVVSVARKDLEEHVVASGRVWVPARLQISAQTPGLVVAVNAVEGQHIKKGDLLILIDDAEARAAVAQATASVDQAKAKVEQLRRVGSIVATESLRQADANLEHAETELERAKSLAASGAIPQTQLDEASHALDIARAQRTAAQAQQIGSTPAGADSRVSLTALMVAQAQLTAAQVRLSQTRIAATQDGVILARSIEPGDVVQPSRTLLVMAADAATQVVFQPDERNLAVLAIGQKARASADAFPQKVFDAEVDYIAPSIDPQRGSVEVRLRLKEPPPYLKPDMTISVDLTVATKPHTLTLPSEAVRGAATPTPWVFVLEGGRLIRKEIELGIRGEGATEILKGVDEGTLVVIPDGQLLTQGQRVRSEQN